MDKIWWKNITKAHKLVDDIVENAAEGKSMLLSLPGTVPWKNTLVDMVEEELRLENPKNAFEYICCPEEEAGLYLLNHYCKKEKRATYRYGMTYAAFLGKCEDIVLNDRYIWVYDIPRNKYDEWVSFVVEYTKNVKEKTPAIFILEVQDENYVNQAKKGIKKLSFSQNIGEYDRFAFCALAATGKSCKEYVRPYLAQMAASICGEDIELCARCVDAGELFLKDPISAIQNIVQTKERSDGTPFVFSRSEDEILTSMWEAQLKCAFPVIEKYRSYFLKEHHEDVEEALQIPMVNSCGEKVEKPEDVEIGVLLFLAARGRITLDQKEHDGLKLFRDARNKLAHLEVLDLQDMEEILRVEKEVLE